MDFETLGTAIAILSKADPVIALATGLVSGILGKLFFDKAANGAKKNREVIEQILILKKEKRDAKLSEQDTSDTSI
jgi:hypothetical protein